MKQKFIETGKAVGTHGIKGEIRFQPWSDCPEDILNYKILYLNSDGSEKRSVTSARVQKNIVLIKFDGCDSIEEAEKLRNKVFYVDRDDISLSPGEHLICDLVGCKVFRSSDKIQLGILSDVSKTGANDVWHIKSGEKEYLIPAIPNVVDSVDIDNEEIFITPLNGIFDFDERDIIR